MPTPHSPPVIEQQEVEELIEHSLDVRHCLLGDGRVYLVHGEGYDAGEGLVLHTGRVLNQQLQDTQKPTAQESVCPLLARDSDRIFCWGISVRVQWNS